MAILHSLLPLGV
ncbi:hypothetical protein CGCF415_v004843 [Colletotrichum fructicola]|uniref:Uncharacterized protein n=1 Tax=Colletotrichum siamense TaxID=690259 RepID=A0A9P5F4S6_COLSI|nr:hypothetical protein CGCSCA4_v000930 [Colletotrichum siamense]KAF4887529.1 hypothetical protein CGCFRS4_v010451 [Colletotrichum fructicola]KAF4926597.1 hypothetical protein CGCVW01_v002905 [Colletotrichum viniferum]KAF5517278.1 hypothetical protein CGCA056_v011244 [Colletotrichum aenigma]KAF4866305.1 hypothetical protein CGCSCA2_v001033 [Colletotrichum siamense]